MAVSVNGMAVNLINHQHCFHAVGAQEILTSTQRV